MFVMLDDRRPQLEMRGDRQKFQTGKKDIERERQKDRKTERQKDRDRETDREKETDKKRKTDRQKEGQMWAQHSLLQKFLIFMSYN